jgi:hypothetical protein
MIADGVLLLKHAWFQVVLDNNEPWTGEREIWDKVW